MTEEQLEAKRERDRIYRRRIDALSREQLEIRQVERPTRKNSESVRDIISEARGVFKELLKHGYAVVSIDRMADVIDRIEAASVAIEEPSF